MKKSVYSPEGYEFSFKRDIPGFVTEFRSLPSKQHIVLSKSTDKETGEQEYELCVKKSHVSLVESLEETARSSEVVCHLNERGYQRVLKDMIDGNAVGIDRFAHAAVKHTRKYESDSTVTLGSVIGIGQYMINRQSSNGMTSGFVTTLQHVQKGLEKVKTAITGKNKV